MLNTSMNAASPAAISKISWKTFTLKFVCKFFPRSGDHIRTGGNRRLGVIGHLLGGGQCGLGGVGVAQRLQRVGQCLPAHGNETVIRLALDLLVIDRVGQVLGKQVCCAAHGGGRSHP